ncbi:MAG: carboxypeptidase-like regulatory domain-containing protein [Methanobacterium sp.]
MKTFLLSFLVLYLTNAPLKEITGKITDRDTSEELAGVRIIVNKVDTTYTDLDGNFRFTNVDSIRTIELKYPSYSSDDFVMTEVNNLLTNKN